MSNKRQYPPGVWKKYAGITLRDDAAENKIKQAIAAGVEAGIRQFIKETSQKDKQGEPKQLIVPVRVFYPKTEKNTIKDYMIPAGAKVHFYDFEKEFPHVHYIHDNIVGAIVAKKHEGTPLPKTQGDFVHIQMRRMEIFSRYERKTIKQAFSAIRGYAGSQTRNSTRARIHRRKVGVLYKPDPGVQASNDYYQR